MKFMTGLLAVSIILAGVFYYRTAAPPATQASSGISVTLSTTKEVFELGEPIVIKVEIHNVGKDPLFIGNEIPTYLDWPYDLKLNLANERGEYSPSIVFAPPFLLPYQKSESIIHAVTSSWSVLPPGYFFGTTMTLDGGRFEFLGKPGKYCVSGIYKAEGMGSPVQFNCLAASPDEVKKLPYRSWIGEVKTNELWITISGPKAIDHK
jgi:hypothetical protein